MPPVQTSDVTISLTGRSMVMDVSDGWIMLPSGKKIALGAGRFSVEDLRPDIEMGRVEFQALGGAQSILELLDHEPYGYAREVGVKPSALGGKVDGKFTIDLPVIKKELTIEEKIQIREEIAYFEKYILSINLFYP